MSVVFSFPYIRRLFRTMTVAGLGLFSGLLAIELFLWVILLTPAWHVLPVVRPILVRPNMESGTELIAGGVFIWPQENRAKVRVSSYGLRNRELESGSSRAEIRVALTGDSVVEALQVDQRFVMDERAEKRLLDLGQDVEIVNLGASGHGPLRQLVRFEDIGFEIEPDYVVSISSAGDFISGELLRDSDHPGYVSAGDGTLKRGDTYRSSFSRRLATRWEGRSFFAALRYSNLFRVLYSMRSSSVPVLLGLPEAATEVAADPCSAEKLGDLHRLWVDNQPQEHWGATDKFFGEYVESVQAAGIVPIYALREIPIPPNTCQFEHNLRSELVASAESYLAGRGLRFVDWDQALFESETFKGLEAESLSILHGFGTALGRGHFNRDGHEASAEVLVAIVLSEIAVRP